MYLKIKVSIALWFQFSFQNSKASSCVRQGAHDNVNIFWQTCRQPSQRTTIVLVRQLVQRIQEENCEKN